jgi:GalNAc-alpha-(1->4)-GalNAc-alpha-(1->3)-diNAcBac-PP-undecaprenol alpha-1,4-N-acetyl-D-galactosaminyltransferase
MPRSRRFSTSSTIQTILAVGRLYPEKGFDLLLEAFAKCAAAHPNWNLRIIGEGPERELLAQLIGQFGLLERVRIDPVLPDLSSSLTQADLFVLSSCHEGFPNVLLEAMAAGVPVISFDCESGPRDIIRHGIDGVLVPAGDVGALALALDRLMGSAADRAQLAERAPEVIERFSLAKIATMWRNVLELVTCAPS